MITGTLKNQIDAIWDTFWSGGISNPLSVIEQMTRARHTDNTHFVACSLTLSQR
jgi:hypothetical protein